MDLNDAIDELYRQPLAGFTAARNALAKTLKADEAKRVKTLAKPTLVPWTVNQLYWRARPVYDRLMKQGEALRSAQIAALKGQSGDLPRASDQHRKSLAESVRRATELAAVYDAQPGADDLGRMLEAVSLAPVPPEHPGRFVELVQPAGFEALAGVTPIRTLSAAPTAAPAAGKAAADPPKRGGVVPFRHADEEAARVRAEKAAAEKEAREAEKRRQEAQAHLKAAEQALERAKAAEFKLRDAYDRAQEERRAAEAALAAAKRASAKLP